MDRKQQPDANMLEQQLEAQLNPLSAEAKNNGRTEIEAVTEKKERTASSAPQEKDLKVLGVGDWMITILFFILPVVNIIMMAVWAFSAKGNVHRKNLSRACLLWIIILLIAYVVAMTVAGFTILDIFQAD